MQRCPYNVVLMVKLPPCNIIDIFSEKSISFFFVVFLVGFTVGVVAGGLGRFCIEFG